MKQRFGQKLPHEMLGIGVGVKNVFDGGVGSVGGRNDGGIAGWSKIPVSHNMVNMPTYHE